MHTVKINKYKEKGMMLAKAVWICKVRVVPGIRS